MAKYKILSSRVSMDSAMKFRDYLLESTGLEKGDILVSRDSANCSGYPVLVRYGCGYGNLDKEPKWNHPRFIQNLCINKMEFSEVFKDTVHTPEFHNRTIPTEFPVLIRETLEGKASEGIIIVKNEGDFMEHWNPAFWWTPYHKFQFELRAYLVLGESTNYLRIYKKIPRGDLNVGDVFVTGENDEDNTFWSLRNNGFYPKVSRIVESMSPSLKEFGGRFMAMDLIYVPDIQDYVVLELNSGPWLSNQCAKWLADIFVEEHKEVL